MKLARREKIIVSLAGCVIALMLIHKLLIGPFFEEKKRLQNGVRAKAAALDEMIILNAEYQELQKGDQGLYDLINKRRKGFTLFSFLEKESAESGVKGHIKHMKPSVSETDGPYKESLVEMKLEGITLKQLVRYLHRIESLENAIFIKRISIKENRKEPGYLDVVLNVLTLQ